MIASVHTYTTIELGPDEYDVRVEAEIISYGTPEVGRMGPIEGYDPGSGAEIDMVRYVVEFPAPAREIELRHIDQHFSARQQARLEEALAVAADESEKEYDW